MALLILGGWPFDINHDNKLHRRTLGGSRFEVNGSNNHISAPDRRLECFHHHRLHLTGAVSLAFVDFASDTRGLAFRHQQKATTSTTNLTSRHQRPPRRPLRCTSPPRRLRSAASTSSPHNSAVSTTIRRVDLFPAQLLRVDSGPPRRLLLTKHFKT